MSKNHFILVIRALIAFFSLMHVSGFWALATCSEIQVNRLSERVIVLTDESSLMKVKTVAVTSQKGIIVIGTQSAPSIANETRKFIEREFKRNDFFYVINTHKGWHNVGGNQMYPESVILAHQNCMDYLRKARTQQDSIVQDRLIPAYKRGINELRTRLKTLEPNSEEAITVRKAINRNKQLINDYTNIWEITPPTMAFQDRLTLDLEDLTLHLYYWGKARSEDSIVIHIPEEKCLITGTVFIAGRHVDIPYKIGKLDVPRWLEVLNTILNAEGEIKHIIPDWGDYMEHKQLVAQRDYIKELWHGVVEATEKGISIEQVLKQYALEPRFNYYSQWYKDGEIYYLHQIHHGRLLAAFWKQFHDIDSAAEVVRQASEKGGYQEAMTKLQEILSAPKDKYYFDEDYFIAMADHYLYLGRIREAIASFQLVVKLFPESSRAYCGLAEALMNSGDKIQALQNIQKALELDPNNRDAKELLVKLKKLDGLNN